MPNYNKLIKQIDQWLQNFESTCKIADDQWDKSKIVEDVLDIESQHKFKSHRERLVFRLETWIDVCRIETELNGEVTEGRGKFRSVKRSKSCKSRSPMITRTRTMSSSVSSDMLSPVTSPKPSGRTLRNRFLNVSKGRTMTSSYSANDLSDQLHDTTTDINFSDASSNSSVCGDEEESRARSWTNTLTCRLFPFVKKQREGRKSPNPGTKRDEMRRHVNKTFAGGRWYGNKLAERISVYSTDDDTDSNTEGKKRNSDHYMDDDVEKRNSVYDNIDDVQINVYDSDGAQINGDPDFSEMIQSGISSEGSSNENDYTFTPRAPSRERPSLFNMKALETSVSDAKAVERTSSVSMPTARSPPLGRGAKDKKFNTVSARNDTLFQVKHNDSMRLHFRRKQIPSRTKKNEADLGSL